MYDLLPSVCPWNQKSEFCIEGKESTRSLLI